MGLLLNDMVDYLVVNGLATGFGQDTFADFDPDSPDFAIILTEYQGSPQPINVTAVHRSVQVKVRDTDDNVELVIERIWKIYKLFRVDNHFIELNNDRWGQFYLRQPPFKSGYDEKNRVSYTFNMGITTQPDEFS